MAKKSPVKKKAPSKKPARGVVKKAAPRSKRGPPPKKAPRKAQAVALDGKQRRYLRGLGHQRDPVVQIGHKGLSAEVKKELDHALVAHELLKVKLLKSAPLTVGEAAKQMSEETGAAVAQTIGKVVLLFRPSPDPERQKIHLPVRQTKDDDEAPTEDLEREEE